MTNKPITNLAIIRRAREAYLLNAVIFGGDDTLISDHKDGQGQGSHSGVDTDVIYWTFCRITVLEGP